MGKKRKQHDTNVQDNEESTGNGEEYSKGSECRHFLKSINLNKLRKIVKDKDVTTCSECEINRNIVKADDNVSSESSPLYICLKCGNIACSKSQINHALKHYETPRTDAHCVAINTFDWSVWCYKCDQNVSNRNVGHKKKILEVTEILKNSKKANKPTQQIQPKLSIPLCQNDISSTNNEKKKILNEFPKVGGLTNLGNTCFFNAVLQCLAQTPYLVKVLDDLQVPEQKIVIPGGKFKGADNKEVDLPPIEGILEKTGIFTPVLRKTLIEMQNSEGQVYRPTELLNSLRKQTMQCTDGGQHDSHELLRHLLEQVRSEDLRRYQTVILAELGLSEKSKRQSADDNLIARLKYYGNQAGAKLLGSERVFRGELYSILQCLECQHSSSRTEPFLDLSLPVFVEKSQSPNLKRKNSSFEGSIEQIGINTSNNSTKHDFKKSYKANNKKNRTNRIKNRENVNTSASNPNRISEEKKGNLIKSEESDADVEDNIESEDVFIPEFGESGYSSEKPSAVTSPVSLSEFQSTDKNVNNLDLNILPIVSDASCSFDITQSAYKNSTSPSPTDVSMIDLTENKSTETTELSLITSLAHSDITSPEGPTISPVSTPFTSKNTSTTSVSSDEEKVLDNTSEQLLNIDSIIKDESSENSTDDKSSTSKKLTNGISDIMSGITKLDLSSSLDLSTRYPIKEGDCSIQLCLNQFTSNELMSGNNKVGCAACTDQANKGKKEGVKMVCTDSTKKYLISHVPAVLILHLKRFQMQRFSFRKVCKHVGFPILLDLAHVSKDYTKPKIYALYGVVEHSGNLYGGHYVAYVKSRAPLKADDPRWSFLPTKDNFSSKDASSESGSDLESEEIAASKVTEVQAPPGQWYHISDSRVSEVDEKTVLQREAYLLFYERIL